MVTINPTQVPSEEHVRREWIKFQLRARGSSLAQVAREYGVSRHAVIKALRVPYPRLELAIAKTLDVSPDVLWPERYTKSGKPNRLRGRPKKDVTKDTTTAPNASAVNSVTSKPRRVA